MLRRVGLGFLCLMCGGDYGGADAFYAARQRNRVAAVAAYCYVDGDDACGCRSREHLLATFVVGAVKPCACRQCDSFCREYTVGCSAVGAEAAAIAVGGDVRQAVAVDYRCRQCGIYGARLRPAHFAHIFAERLWGVQRCDMLGVCPCAVQEIVGVAAVERFG